MNVIWQCQPETEYASSDQDHINPINSFPIFKYFTHFASTFSFVKLLFLAVKFYLCIIFLNDFNILTFRYLILYLWALYSLNRIFASKEFKISKALVSKHSLIHLHIQEIDNQPLLVCVVSCNLCKSWHSFSLANIPEVGFTRIYQYRSLDSLVRQNIQYPLSDQHLYRNSLREQSINQMTSFTLSLLLSKFWNHQRQYSTKFM